MSKAGRNMEPSSAHWDKVWEQTSAVAPHDTVLAAIAELQVGSILEMGAGSGRDLEELHRRGHDVVFSDFSPIAVHRFSRRNPDIPAILADCRRLPFYEESFDLVFSLGLLEHFEPADRQTIIQEKFRVARRYVLIDVPQTLSLATIIKKVMMVLGKWPYGEETQFTFSQLVQELRKARDVQEIVVQYGRELIPLPRSFKGIFYSRLSASIKRIFLRSHALFAKGIAGSFGIVVAKTRD